MATSPKYTPSPFPSTRLSHGSPLWLTTPNALPRHNSPSYRDPVTFACHPRPDPSFAPHTPSPPQTPRQVSLLHSLPHAPSPRPRPRFPSDSQRAFPNLPLALLHAPKHLRPATASSPPPAPRPGPGVRDRHLLHRPSRLPGPRGSRVDENLGERGLRRATPDPRCLYCSPPPESWGAESPLGSLRK